MTFYIDGQAVSRIEANRVAYRRAVQERGMDVAELSAITDRLAHSEEAREMFFDMTEIEVVL